MSDRGVCRTAPATPGLLITTPCLHANIFRMVDVRFMGGAAINMKSTLIWQQDRLLFKVQNQSPPNAGFLGTPPNRAPPLQNTMNQQTLIDRVIKMNQKMMENMITQMNQNMINMMLQINKAFHNILQVDGDDPFLSESSEVSQDNILVHKSNRKLTKTIVPMLCFGHRI